MLSPLDLQNKKVVTKKRKYDKLEMDEYLNLVFDNYKELFNQNQELQKQVKTLSDGIQYYRSIESTMQKALVLAEKTSKETKDAAILKAEAIEKDANTKAAKIVSAAEQEYESIKDKCLYLVQQFNQYKMQLKQVAAAQLELITSDSFDVYSPELDGLYNAKHSLPVKDEEPVPSQEIIVDEDSLKSQETAADVAMSSYDSNLENVPEVESKPLEEMPEPVKKEVVKEEQKEAVYDLDKTMVLPDIKTELVKDDKIISEEDEVSILTADTIDLRSTVEQLTKDKSDRESAALEVEKPGDADGPTLDSLLQNMNLNKKKKKAKGQDEDPFEFLGSVDDF